ncbi:MAG: ArsR/SmtB family transcription factor [Thermoplasmatota archaeon]
MNEEIKVVSDIEKVKVPLEDTRNKILSLLSIKEMSVSEIADALNKELSNINRHLKKLERADFIEVVGEKRNYNVPERVYGRTASVFMLDIESQNQDNIFSSILEWDMDYDRSTLEYLDRLGYKNNADDELLNDILDFFHDLNGDILRKIKDKKVSFDEIDYIDAIHLKFLIYLLEINNNPQIKMIFKDIFSDFERRTEI